MKSKAVDACATRLLMLAVGLALEPAPIPTEELRDIRTVETTVNIREKDVREEEEADEDRFECWSSWNV